MGKEDKLLEKVGRDTGMKVPEGYFSEFATKIMADLPEYPQQPIARQLTFWQKVKPYVYMAAMFAGIWCMMKMFHIASQNASMTNLDNPPESVVLAVDDSETFDYYYDVTDDDGLTDFDMENAVASEYDNIAEFEKDFGYKIKPEYDNI